MEGHAASYGVGFGGVEPIHQMRIADPLLIAWTNATVDVQSRSTIGSY
jgi:hypothetical protein